MTFRKHHRFLRRLVMSLAFAAVTAGPAAARPAPDEPGIAPVQVTAPSDGTPWLDAAYVVGGVAAFAGAAGCVSVAIRARGSLAQV